MYLFLPSISSAVSPDLHGCSRFAVDYLKIFNFPDSGGTVEERSLECCSFAFTGVE